MSKPGRPGAAPLPHAARSPIRSRQKLGPSADRSPTAALTTSADLEVTNAQLREECTALQRRVGSIRDHVGSLEAERARVASLSSRLSELVRQQVDADAAWREDEARWAVVRRGLDLETVGLREEGARWRRRNEWLEESASQSEHEVVELEEEVASGVQERRKLQAECISLQQECEDARRELQETHDLLREGGAAVERMVRQKVELEAALQEQQQRHAVLRRVLQQAGHELEGEAGAERRRCEELKRTGRLEIEWQRAEAERYKCTAVAHRNEALALNIERARLEREIPEREAEVAMLAQRAAEVQQGELGERQLERMAKELLSQSRDGRRPLIHQLACVKGQKDLAAAEAEAVNLQEQQARLLFGQACRQAAEVLGHSSPTLLGSIAERVDPAYDRSLPSPCESR